jgi:hypothetical protein
MLAVSNWASEKAVVVEAVLGRRRAVLAVEANPVAQTVALTYDAQVISLVEMSVASMVAGLRNRLMFAPVFSVLTLWWSPIGRAVLGSNMAAPFRLLGGVPVLPRPGMPVGAGYLVGGSS